MKMYPAIFVLVILASLARAQEQVDLEKEFDRLCMIDWLYTEEELGPDFSLQILFHDAPVTGARIELEHDGKVIATARTNSRGLADFSAIPVGEYHPQAADGLVFPLGRLVIKVVANHRLGERAKLEWPAETISVRTLSGRLTTSENVDDPSTPLHDIKVELLELRTGKLIESARTNTDGLYDFSQTKPGLYALRVTPKPLSDKDKPQSHDIAVELDPQALEGMIPEMKVLQSECAGVQLFREESPGDWEPE